LKNHENHQEGLNRINSITAA